MRLFAFKPKAFGGHSFYVTAETEAEAVNAVRQYIVAEIASAMKDGEYDGKGLRESDVAGWPENYELTIANPLVVISNPND